LDFDDLSLRESDQRNKYILRFKIGGGMDDRIKGAKKHRA